MRFQLLLLLLIFVIIVSYNNVQSIYCYNCTTCTTSSPGIILPGCTLCATIVYSTNTQKLCAATCIGGSYQGGFLSCCTTDYCNSNTPLSSSLTTCYECSTCSSSSSGSLTYGCGACATTVYSTYTQKECVATCSPGSYQGGYKSCCYSNYCNSNTPLSSSLTCYECSTCSSSSSGSLTYGCGACATTVYSSYTRKDCVASCSPGSYGGGYRYCCSNNYCNNDIPDITCYSCLLCFKPFQTYNAKVIGGCTSCATIDYPNYSHKYCASSCTPQSYDDYKISCCDTSYCNSGYQIYTSKKCFVSFLLLLLRLII